MQLFNKPLEKWELKDLEFILNDPDYKESEYLDYKKDFSFLKIDNRALKHKEKDEFRHDICSFTNSDGGFLIFGVTEKKVDGVPVPNELVGIGISNTETFEQARRQEISKISPVTPNVKFKFMLLEDKKYIVIIEVTKGLQTPYVNIENNHAFKYLKRDGNGKRPMSYKEVQNMYNQSISLLEKIVDFRNKQFKFLDDNDISYKGEKKIIIHVIPSTFLDYETYVNPFILESEKEIIYRNVFRRSCPGDLKPNVDGICYSDLKKENKNGTRFQVYNNNIVEKTMKTDSLGGILLFKEIEEFAEDSIKYFKMLKLYCNAFICVSVFGFLNEQTEYNDMNLYRGAVDRNKIFCRPVGIFDINDKSRVQEAIYNQKLFLCNALAIKNLKKFCGDKPIKENYSLTQTEV